MKETIRIGCGAGFSGDRIEPALVLVEKGSIDFLVLECLAERTIALAQKRKLQDPATGYDPLLERRIELLIEPLKKNKVRLITNMGAANPLMAMEKILAIAKRKNISIKVAAVTGDDVLDRINQDDNSLETGEAIRKAGIVVSANAYLGIEGILEALSSDADVIITGRVADPSLFLAPMIDSFQWPTDNYDLLGKATVLGHLMECAGQVTGGYYADPGKKEVRNMANLGHPILEVSSDGSGIITKVDGTGGEVTLGTAKEQLLYEVVNPFEYYTPDVIADFTTVFLTKAGDNKVLVTGGGGKEKPGTLKVSIGYQAGYLGEGEITYAGSNAVERAKLAGEIVYERLRDRFEELRVDLIGLNSVHGSAFHHTDPYEVRLRIAGKAADYSLAAQVGEEIEALYTNGPGGGGGARKYVHEMIGIVSTLIDRKRVKPLVTVKSI
ncbi:acyclic terpene utilization AtuA family protein [Pollutibacter soli]|uniref:acyclic terpene utilization AtuA family protein n=1 Tax=Pollutibacter soli TaxID=3034157 RepID=UPI003013FFB8